jgi:hypothetical protein
MGIVMVCRVSSGERAALTGSQATAETDGIFKCSRKGADLGVAGWAVQVGFSVRFQDLPGNPRLILLPGRRWFPVPGRVDEKVGGWWTGIWRVPGEERMLVRRPAGETDGGCGCGHGGGPS